MWICLALALAMRKTTILPMFNCYSSGRSYVPGHSASTMGFFIHSNMRMHRFEFHKSAMGMTYKQVIHDHELLHCDHCNRPF